jgi:hypothetical protein
MTSVLVLLILTPTAESLATKCTVTSFTTDASGTLGITLNAISDTGSVFDFDFIVEKCNWFAIYQTTYFLHLFLLAEDVMCSSTGVRALLTRIMRARARSDFMKSKVILVNSWEKSI